VQTEWRPCCSQDLLLLRAQLLRKIRDFFSQRDTLEVETPLLCQGIGTDPQLAFFTSEYDLPPHRRALFLQTSPEFAMKRLLAAGSGDIFQICKAFRNGEAGRHHNPEFTLLEWYRVGFNLPQLMDEAEALIGGLFAGFGLSPSVRTGYRDVFFFHTGLDPFEFDFDRYQAHAESTGLPEAAGLCGQDPALWLDLLFSHQVQPALGVNALAMVHGFPACQPSLARLNARCPLATERVELFINGMELGNGYHELSDPAEQERRFDRDIASRRRRGLPVADKDQRLLAALRSGLPDCSGMALGLDRILMLLSGAQNINDVLAFPIHAA